MIMIMMIMYYSVYMYVLILHKTQMLVVRYQLFDVSCSMLVVVVVDDDHDDDDVDDDDH